MEVEHRGDGIIVVTPTDALDASSTDRFRLVLVGLPTPPRLVVDLSRVSFVDSAGLAVVIDAARWARQRGGALAVACTRPTLARLLRTRGFDRLVAVAETIEEAAAALDPPDPDGRPA